MLFRTGKKQHNHGQNYSTPQTDRKVTSHDFRDGILPSAQDYVAKGSALGSENGGLEMMIR